MGCKCDLFHRPNSTFVRLTCTGGKRDAVYYNLKRIIGNIITLPEVYCTLCYDASHTEEDCESCSFCLTNEHKYYECDRYTGPKKESKKSFEELSRSAKDARNRQKNKDIVTKAYWKLGVRYEYTRKLYDDFVAIDVEKSMFNDGSPATQVCITSKFPGVGS